MRRLLWAGLLLLAAASGADAQLDDASAYQAKAATCSQDPGPCILDADTCPPGSDAACRPLPLCRARLDDLDASCPATSCPVGIESPRCQEHVLQWKPPHCPVQAYADQHGTHVCEATPIPAPTCQEAGGTPTDDGCTGDPLALRKPVTAAYATMQCTSNAVVIRWGGYAQRESAGGAPDMFAVDRRVDGSWNTFATTGRTGSSATDHAAQGVHEYRVRYIGATGESPGDPIMVRVQDCPSITVHAPQTSGPQVCPPAVTASWSVGSGNRFEQQGFRIERTDDVGATRTFDIDPSHPMLQSDGTRYSFHDYTVQPGRTYAYQATYLLHHRGQTTSGISTSSSIVMDACTTPRITGISYQEPAAFRIDWQWNPYNDAMAWWVQDLRIERTAEHPTGIDTTGLLATTNALQGAVLRHVLPGPTGASSLVDAGLFAQAGYRYQVIADTAAGTLRSNWAEGSFTGTPWPPQWLRVDVRPLLEPSDTYYPKNLPDEQEYGQAALEWRLGPDGGHPVTGIRVEFHADATSIGQGKATHTCVLEPDATSIVFPDDFQACGAGVPSALPRDSLGHWVRVQARNAVGWGPAATLTGMEGWSLVEGQTTETRHASADAAPYTDRRHTVERVDRVLDRVYEVESMPLPGPRQAPRVEAVETSWQDEEEPVTRTVNGTPCTSDVVLQFFITREVDEYATGVDRHFLSRPFPMEDVLLAAFGWSSSIDTGASRFHEHAHDPMGSGRNPVAGQLMLGRDLGLGGAFSSALPYYAEIQGRPTTIIALDGAHGAVLSADAWSADHILHDVDDATAGRLPWNAIGDYCWIDGVFFFGEPLGQETPMMGARISFEDTSFSFTHRSRLEGTRQTALLDAGFHGGDACACLLRTESRSQRVHELHQAFITPHNRYVELVARGSHEPLAGIASLDHGSGTPADYQGLGRQHPVIHGDLTNAHMALIQQRNRELAHEARVDVRDSLSRDAELWLWEHFDEVRGAKTFFLLQPWLEIRPDLGLLDRRGDWYVAGNAAPVAYVGGLAEPWRSAMQEAGWTWDIKYQWEGPGTTPDWQAEPWPHAQAWSIAEYDAHGGEAAWSVSVRIRILDHDDVERDRIDLHTQATFRYDRLSLTDSQATDIGFPVIKDDRNHLGNPMLRAWWYTDRPAPWETFQEPSGPGSLYGEGNDTSLTRGRGLKAEARNEYILHNPDPVEGLTSPEEPRARHTLEGQELERWQATNDFQAIYYIGGPDSDDAAVHAEWVFLTGADIAAHFGVSQDQVAGDSPIPLPDGLVSTDDGIAYSVQQGHTLSYLLLVRPLRGMGELEDGDDAQLAKRSTVNLVAEYDRGDSGNRGHQHPQSIDAWTRVTVPLEPGSLLEELRLVVDHPPCSRDDEAACVYAAYVDDVSIENEATGRIPLYSQDAHLGAPRMTRTGTWQNTGDLWHAPRIVETRIETETAPFDDNPFLEVRRIIPPTSDEEPGFYHQSHIVSGTILGTIDREPDRYAPTGRMHSQMQQLQAGGDTVSGPESLGYQYHIGLHAGLAWDGDAWMQTPRREAMVSEEDGELVAWDVGPVQEGFRRVGVATPDLEYAYAHLILLDTDPNSAQRFDAVTSQIDGVDIANLDGTRTFQTTREGHVDGSLAAAPTGPFWDTPAVPLRAEQAYVIDLATRASWSLGDLRNEAEQARGSGATWLHIRPWTSQLQVCYRWDDSDWQHVALLRDSVQESDRRPGETLHLRIRLMLDTDSSSDCAAPGPGPSIDEGEGARPAVAGQRVYVSYHEHIDDSAHLVERFIHVGDDGSWSTSLPYASTHIEARYDADNWYATSAAISMPDVQSGDVSGSDGVLGFLAIFLGLLVAVYAIKWAYRQFFLPLAGQD